MNNNYYTIKEAAKKLEVHWQTIRNYIKAGDIKAVKIGRTVRIPQSEFDRLFSTQNRDKRKVEISFNISDYESWDTKLKVFGAKFIGHSHIIDHYYCDRNIQSIEDYQSVYEKATGFELRIRQTFIDESASIYQTLEVKKLAGPTYNDYSNCFKAETVIQNFDDIERIIFMMNQKRLVSLEKELYNYQYEDFSIIIHNIYSYGFVLEIQKITNDDVIVVKQELHEIAANLGFKFDKEIFKDITNNAIKKLANFAANL